MTRLEVSRAKNTTDTDCHYSSASQERSARKAAPPLPSLHIISKPVAMGHHHENTPSDSPYGDKEAESLIESHTMHQDNGLDRKQCHPSLLWVLWAFVLTMVLGAGILGFLTGSRMPTNETCAQEFSTWSEYRWKRGPDTMFTRCRPSSAYPTIRRIAHGRRFLSAFQVSRLTIAGD
jgi:hypothetical protein